MKNLEIKPLNGIGEIKFGMPPDEVKRIMNEKEVWENWMGGNLNDSLIYHGVILTFDKCDSHGPLKDSQLDTIQIYQREDISLFGKLIIEWTEESLTQYLNDNKIDYSFKNSSIELNQLSLSIYFDKKENSIWIEFDPWLTPYQNSNS